MFILEENKVVFVATDLIDPGEYRKTVSSSPGYLDMYPPEMYGCKCASEQMQNSAYAEHTYYSFHTKVNHKSSAGNTCPKCGTLLNEEEEMYTCKCGVLLDLSEDYIFMWD